MDNMINQLNIIIPESKLGIPSQYTSLIDKYIYSQFGCDLSNNDFVKFDKNGINTNMFPLSCITITKEDNDYTLTKGAIMSSNYFFFLCEQLFIKILSHLSTSTYLHIAIIIRENSSISHVKSLSRAVRFEKYDMCYLVENIYNTYVNNGNHYSIMLFEFDDSTIDSFLFTLQKYILGQKQFAFIWDNLDLLSSDINCIYDNAANHAPIIATYDGIYNIYENAANQINCDKVIVNNALDKANSIEFVINVFKCNCSKQKLEQSFGLWEQQKNNNFESMWRSGRIDGYVEIIDKDYVFSDKLSNITHTYVELKNTSHTHDEL